MAEKKQNDSDVDYGLPKVEIKPLSQYSGTVPLPIKPQETQLRETGTPPPASKEAGPAVNLPQEQAPKNEKMEVPFTKGEKPLGAVPKEVALPRSPQKAKLDPEHIPTGDREKAQARKESKPQSYAWIWIVVILGLGVGAWAIYKAFQVPTEVEQEPVAENIEETPPVTPAPPVEEEMEEPVEKIGLTEIRAREANPRFFVVVGSFNNEAMAKDFSENLHQKEMNTFLVYPYGDIKNYRLAIAHFPSFDQALNELNRVKGDFTQDLWVLKY